MAGQLGRGECRGVRETVAGADDELVEGVLRVQPVAVAARSTSIGPGRPAVSAGGAVAGARTVEETSAAGNEVNAMAQRNAANLGEVINEALDAVEHGVEVDSHLIPFVARPAQRNPLP